MYVCMYVWMGTVSSMGLGLGMGMGNSTAHTIRLMMRSMRGSIRSYGGGGEVWKLFGWAGGTVGRSGLVALRATGVRVFRGFLASVVKKEDL